MPQNPRRSFLVARTRITYGRPQKSLMDDHDNAESTDPTKKPSFQLHACMNVTGTPTEAQPKSLRASRELREAGQGHRFQDELEYLLEGIQEHERLQVRRTSCVELTRSMTKQDFALHVLNYGHWPAIARVLVRSRDQIIIPCLSIIMTILAQRPEAYNALCETDGLREFIFNGLELDQDPFTVIPDNRRDVASINILKEVVQQSGIIRRGQRVMVSSILLAGLAHLSDGKVQSRGLKGGLNLGLFDEAILAKILELLVLDMAWLKHAAESPQTSLSDLIDLDRSNSILQIFEGRSRTSVTISKLVSARPKFFQIVAQLLVLSRGHAFQGADEGDAAALMTHTLRLLVNITHENESCCEVLAQHGAVSILTVNILQLHGHSRRQLHSLAGRQSNDEDGTHDWHSILLLSVGLIINMLEKSSARRHEFLNTAAPLECSGVGVCFHGDCVCAKSDQALERIIAMYKAETNTLVEGNVLAAYLAVLIIRIIGNESNGQQRLVRAVGMDGLQGMQELLESFALFYKGMLETSEVQGVSENRSDALQSKKDSFNDDKIRQTYQSILTTSQILKHIQESRMVG